MGTRSRARALLDRRIASNQASGRFVSEKDRWADNKPRVLRDFYDVDREMRYWHRVYSDPAGDRLFLIADYEPAVKLGLDTVLRANLESIEEVDHELAERWERTRGSSNLDWSQARPIVEAVLRRCNRL